jgi:ligand-binding sensor domain-containing protein/two-component sensor histidine kinase
MNLSLVTRAFLSAVLLVVAWCPYAFALNAAFDLSQYAHTSWKIRDGHFKGLITAIAQPPDGYLWVGTELGVVRFDGVRFVPWQPPPGQPLPSNNIRGLLSARDGTLWIATDRGLASWKDGQLTRYEALAGNYIGNRLAEDRDGTIWMTKFVDRWSLCGIQKMRVTCHGDDGGAGAGAIGLYVDTQGNLWVGTSAGVWRWRPGAPTFYQLPAENNGIQGLAEDADGSLLISTTGGIRRLAGDRFEMRYPFPAPLPQIQALRLLRDRDGGLWAGTSIHGIVHVHNGLSDVFSRIDGLSGDGILAFFEDREGSIWVATTDGLDRFRESAAVSYSVNQGLSSSRLSAVLAASDGSVWVSTFDGLNRWKDGQMTVYRERRAQPAAGFRPFVSRQVREINVAGIPGGVQALFEDRHRRVWVATSRGLSHLENDKLVALNGVPGGLFRAIVEDIHGTLWIANLTAGLFRMTPDGQVTQTAWSVFERRDPASAMVADPSGEGVWAGFFRGGIAHFDGGRVRATYDASKGLAAGRVSALYVDTDRALWVATTGGLSRLKNGSLATLTSSNGLPCDSIGWMIEDAARSLWLGTACGLARIARKDIDAWTAAVAGGTTASDRTRRVHVATTLDQSDGVSTLGDASYYTAPVVRAADGKLWFVAQGGLSVVDPARLPVNLLPAPIHIEQVIADRQTYRVMPSSSEPLRLPRLTRDLQIDYTAVSLVAPEKMRFRYKLEEHDRDWQDVGTRRQAFYNDLPPGSYRFRVSASNNSGMWNGAGGLFEFTIPPAYYQTPWFRTAAIVTVLALVWGAYRLRLRQIAHAFNLRLNERVNERTRIARELHDTLLQSFQGLMLRFQSARDLLPAHPEKAVEALDGALERADQAIVEGRDAIQNLRASTTTSNELAQAIARLAEELTQSSGGDRSPATFWMQVEGTPRDLHPIVRDDIHRIAREALRNAFRHAQADRIEAEITYGPREVRLRIRDDGKGMDPKHLHDGRARHWGLAGMRERAVHIGAQLDLWSEVGAGTEVELRIPGAVAYGPAGDRGNVSPSVRHPSVKQRGGS